MISLIIPTRNRKDFLLRQLYYYFRSDFEGYIYIGDSSDPDVSKDIEQSIKPFCRKLKIMYYKFPTLGEAQTTCELLSHVSTPYVVWIADDDFLIPKGLRICVNFLESHLEYNAAHGKAVALNLEKTDNTIRIIGSWKYRQPIVEGKNASERILNYIKNGGDVHYSIHRVKSMRNMYKYAHMMLHHHIAAAETPCFMSAIQGSIKELNCLTLVRGVHESHFSFKSEDLFHRIINPQWINSYNVLYNSLIKELSDKDNIDFSKSKDIITEVFKTRLLQQQHKNLTDEKRKLPKHGILEKIKNRIKYNQSLYFLLQKLRGALTNSQDLSPQVLLREDSPYHNDFMLILKIITGEQHDFEDLSKGEL